MNNFIHISGFAGRDVEMAATPNGVTVAKYSIAVSKKNKQGGFDTMWVPCVSYSVTADKLRGVLTKGSRVTVAGELNLREYTAKDGTQKKVAEVIGWSVTVEQRTKPEAEIEKPQVMFEPTMTEEDVPF